MSPTDPASDSADSWSPGALDGLVVADFTRVLAGPYATMMLADLGAEVVKIERPGAGDDTRSWGPPFTDDGMATYFASVNRNKESVTLDLRDADDLARARDLALAADVVIENFRAGTMDRLGLGYDELRSHRQDLVYCSITGFGRDGGAALPGYDLLVQAVGGLMSVTGAGPDEPVKVGVAVVDVLAGLHAGMGILAALRHRDRTGEGQRVDVDLFSVSLSSLVNQASGFLNAGVVPQPMGNRHPSIAPYQVFSTATRPIALAVGNDGQFAKAVEVLGRPDLAADERFTSNAARVAHRDDLIDEITAVLVTRDADHWYAEFTAAGVPAGPINSVAEAFDFADDLGVDARATTPDSPVITAANPIRLSATPVTYRSGPPTLGSGSATADHTASRAAQNGESSG
ncbi:CoA transferase [Gordonia otitidis]|uniref:CaiB/BaiF CoA transferase family protein n=1 Tax=Gordonia otitidis TaxID=249058 RepID=UPI001D15B912|nr:CaiB/BaiF CoA-transferase family protein [Gordonia otitidis]UEA57501.1 CoA transferase [Gordonia otitidis]